MIASDYFMEKDILEIKTVMGEGMEKILERPIMKIEPCYQNFYRFV